MLREEVGASRDGDLVGPGEVVVQTGTGEEMEWGFDVRQEVNELMIPI